MTERLHRIPEVADILGCGRTKVYDLLQSGQLKSVKVGSMRRVHSEDLATYLASLRRSS
ncbi:helix-turn-helix domain-containing protein [Phycicoccus sp. HDW14]|uniref:helix-turn-helix domain-containing protein n=1 Tax=Phycicoccus sp. HDW14 TaxID=2714941 RepID=UPI00140A87BF|nr:helix-turn-helix domain-containing protein [Phycicoccus sp. HDW14]QIM22142.1 helix-turn-helix domain-containing protein [Phycicoccus sp. HDW14]